MDKVVLGAMKHYLVPKPTAPKPTTATAAPKSSRPGKGGVKTTGIPPPPTVNTSVLGWATFFYESIAVCGYAAEIDGSNKRFPIAQAMLIVGSTTLVFSFFVVLPFVGNVLTALTLAAGFSLLSLLFLTLYITYSFTFRCIPALPLQLADDIMYFLGYTFFSLCDWLLAAGYVVQSTYTNDNCYACSMYEANTFTLVNCQNDLPFADFGYYLSYYLNQNWPAAITWIETTTLPIFSQLRTFAFVQDRVNAFRNYNATNPLQFSQFNRCAYGETALASFMVMSAYLALLALAWPLVQLGFAVIFALLYLAYAIMTAFGVMLVALVSLPAVVAEAAAKAGEAPPLALGAASLGAAMTSAYERVRRLRQRKRRQGPADQYYMQTLR